MSIHRRHAFTLVELLVVIAIIGVMLAVTIPAVQASRETGRRALCQNNLAQLALALQSYDNAYESLPSGVTNPTGPIRSEAQGLHQGWLIQMLPYLDDRPAFRAFDFSASVYAPANAPVRKHFPYILFCPSEPDDVSLASSYAGCHHEVEAPIDTNNQGLLFLNSHVRREDVSDGMSHTLVLGEKRSDATDLGWLSGTRTTLRNTGLPPNTPAPAVTDPQAAPLFVGGFGSPHVGGMFIALADGNIRFLADTIDPQVWQQLGHRADGKLLEFDLSE